MFSRIHQEGVKRSRSESPKGDNMVPLGEAQVVPNYTEEDLADTGALMPPHQTLTPQ